MEVEDKDKAKDKTNDKTKVQGTVPDSLRVEERGLRPDGKRLRLEARG